MYSVFVVIILVDLFRFLTMSMQRNDEYCMHKMHRSYIYMVQRREGGLLLLEFVVVVVGEGDSCVKEKSTATELHRRGTIQ